MLGRQRIRTRLALAIVLTALLPVGAAIVLARSMVQQSSERFFVPELRPYLEMSLGAYRDLTSVTKASMRHQASALALDPTLRSAAATADWRSVRQRLAELVKANDNLVRLSVSSLDGEEVAEADRGRPLDPAREHQLIVARGLDVSALPSSTASPGVSGQPAERGIAAVNGVATAPPAATAPPLANTATEEAEPAVAEEDDSVELGNGPQLQALFAVPKERFDQFEALGSFIDAYAVLEDRRGSVESTYVLAFAALLGITIVLAIGGGTLLARGVATRLSELASATREVAGGDLSIRVRDEGRDEISELARAFNRMLEEVDNSRNRIEYLSRLASWQEMARRLAHEIKNPLTPIQLAVQEVHQRLSKLAPEERHLLDTTLEIVESEVQTLKRLVGEFSEFARLPESHMEAADLFEFLRDISTQSGGRAEYFSVADAGTSTLIFEIPESAAPVELDRQMMRRALFNLIKNALEASRGRSEPGRVRVSAEVAAHAYVICVDDNGPGVSKELQNRVFEPYMTTKDDGTGLGLAIVKKVVIDHRGVIEMTKSEWGGARVRLQLPRVRGSSLNEI